jgi:prepilin-type N-terminal cleavage/methylation domain-containing protein
MKKTKMSGEKGFSLLEVLVAVAVMGGLSLVMLQMNQNQLKQQKTVELKGEISDIMTVIRHTLNNEEACNATFKGTNFDDKNLVDEIRSTKDFDKPPLARIGNVKFQNFNVYIKEMRLLTRAEEVSMGINNVISTVDGFGRATFKITFVKNIGAIDPASTSREFFGGKETVQYVTIHGYFYDENIIETTVEEHLNTVCENLADVNGVTCDLDDATDGECQIEQIFPPPGTMTPTTSIGDPKFQAYCRFYRQDSPLGLCKSI